MTVRVGPPGILVAFEGIDGAGKSTQARRLATSLEALGHTVVRTREPTDGPWGRILRNSATTGRLSPQEELETFIQDRQQHVAECIRPALDAGSVVVIDRYYFSSMAYQGARGMDPETILRRNEAFAPPPDLLVLLTVPAAAGVARVIARGGNNLFEQEEDLRRAAALFAALQRPYLLRLDGHRPEDTLAAEILAAVQQGPLRGRVHTVDAR